MKTVCQWQGKRSVACRKAADLNSFYLPHLYAVAWSTIRLPTVTPGAVTGWRCCVEGLLTRHIVEVDAARLLLLLSSFAREVTPNLHSHAWFPREPVVRHFTPEYHLQKLDFLLRYPAYLAYELIELYRDPGELHIERSEIAEIVRNILREREPELETRPFIRFRFGAYEPLDAVESWWTSRKLVYTRTEPRSDSRPQKHYFLTDRGLDTARRLPEEIAVARWYAERAHLIYQYFGHFSPAVLKDRQYTHETYRTARPGLFIPDLPLDVIESHFTNVFQEALEVAIEAASTS